MSSLLPAALRPPKLAGRLRMGRCAEGVVLWLHPAAEDPVCQALIAAWWDALRAQAGARGFSSSPVSLVRTEDRVTSAYAFRPALSVGPRGAPDGRTRRCALDELPGVRAVAPAPPVARVDVDEDDDHRDIFEDYAELSGMSRDEWMLSAF